MQGIHQAASGLFRQVHLGHIARHYHFAAHAHAGQEHLHLLARGVLRLVEDDDGIRDLMLDINNAGESVEVINRMMEWSSRYDLHIHCVLHLNKGDNNVRGHIGTEMSNKAETVLVITKSAENPVISEVHALHIRE